VFPFHNAHSMAGADFPHDVWLMKNR
jgi:hypothetical protein